METMSGDIGYASSLARQKARESGFPWIVVLRPFGSFGTTYSTMPSVERSKNGYSTKDVIYTATPHKRQESESAIMVTPEQKELLAFILSDENDRQVYPGTEETKISLLAKIKKSMTKGK